MTGCNVGVEGTVGPFLVGAVAAYINSGATIQSDETLYSFSTHLNAGASVGSIATDKLTGDTAAVHGKISTFPEMPTAPMLPQGTAGTTAVRVEPGTARTLGSGTYGSLTVNAGAKLSLLGGKYVFSSVTLNSGARLLATAPTTILVTGEAGFNTGSVVGPSVGSGLTAKDFVMYFETSSGISLSAGVQVQALFVATKALVSLNASMVTGALAAAQVVMNSGATVACQDGLGALTAGCSELCDDGNPCTIDACPGSCTHTPVGNGTHCVGTNKCDQTYTCQNGVCTGGSPVICTAVDQCHTAGTCDPTNGLCSDPPAADGTTCDDGNACTTRDSCTGGICGGTLVTCTAMDQCHAVGACDPANGLCSNPPAPDGTTCTDGSACTQTDTCQGGTCVGANVVVCAASDPCHVVGSCDPITGNCSNPPVSASACATTSIGSQGGIVQLPGVAQVNIPAGALNAPTDVFIEQITTSSIPNSGIVPTTVAVTIGPEGLTFPQPVSLTLTYNPRLLPGSAPAGNQEIYQLVDNSLVLGGADEGRHERAFVVRRAGTLF